MPTWKWSLFWGQIPSVCVLLILTQRWHFLLSVGLCWFAPSLLLWGRCTWLFCVCIPEAWRSSFFPSGSDGKDSASTAGGPGLIPGWGRSPGGGHGNPLQRPCLENPTDRGAWWGCPPWGRKESDTTDGVSYSFNTSREEDSRGPHHEISFFLPICGMTWRTESWSAEGLLVEVRRSFSI